MPYFFTMMAQFFAFSHVASIYLLPFIIFFGICFNLMMFAKDVEQNITTLGDLMRQYTECVSIDRAQELSLDMKIMLQKLIQFHGEAKKLRISCNLSCYLGKLLLICSILFYAKIFWVRKGWRKRVPKLTWPQLRAYFSIVCYSVVSSCFKCTRQILFDLVSTDHKL